MRSMKSPKIWAKSPQFNKGDKPFYRNECLIRKANSFPVERTLQMEMAASDPQQVAQNPFLKARMQAFLRKVNSPDTKQSRTSQVNGDCSDMEAGLFEDGRVTFKKVRHSGIGSLKNIADDFSKKYQESGISSKTQNSEEKV